MAAPSIPVAMTLILKCVGFYLAFNLCEMDGGAGGRGRISSHSLHVAVQDTSFQSALNAQQ